MGRESVSVATRFPRTDVLADTRILAISESGVEVLSDDEVVELLLNPFALFDLFDVIGELGPDTWLPLMQEVGREMMRREGVAPTLPQTQTTLISEQRRPARQETNDRQRVRRPALWMGVGTLAAAVLVAVGTMTYFSQRAALSSLRGDYDRLFAETQALQSENERLRVAQQAGSSVLEYMSAHAPRPANWDLLLENFYLPQAPAEENLAQLIKVVDPTYKTEILKMQAKHQSAEQILNTLFRTYGFPKKR